jgi:hypothetical protein
MLFRDVVLQLSQFFFVTRFQERIKDMNRDQIATVASEISKLLQPLLEYIDQMEAENKNIAPTQDSLNTKNEPSRFPKTMGKHVISLPESLDTKAWGRDSGGLHNVEVADKGIEVTFPKGQWAARAGVNVKCQPRDVFPANDIKAKYRVYVPDEFDYVRGGKLPGFALGTRGTGGRAWRKDQGSVRLMFRPGGVVTGYLYLFEDVGKYAGKGSPLMKKQGDGFEDICHHSNGAGIYVWRHEKNPLRLKRGWNTISLRVAMNDEHKANGRLVLKVNGQKKQFSKIMWTANPQKNKVGMFQLSAWMGGGDKKYAPNHDQTLIFKDIQLVKRS